MSVKWTPEQMVQRLQHIHDRIQWMADQEALSAWVNGWAADGHLWAEKERLIAEAERLLEQLEKPSANDS